MGELKTCAVLAHARGTALSCVASLLALTGCGSGHATYPDGLTPLTPTEATSQVTSVQPCPDLAGRYWDTGRLAPDTPQELCKSALHSSKFRDIGDWECETSLSLNIGGTDSSGAWIELRQPDSDTLVVTVAESSQPPVELHRSKGEFDCTAEGLTRNLKASLTSQGYDQGQENTATKVYNAFAAITLAFTATGGVQALGRTFSRASDGSLLMHVERTTRGVMFAIPINMNYATWVTWPAELPNENPPATPMRQSVPDIERFKHQHTSSVLTSLRSSPLTAAHGPLAESLIWSTR